jgi:hypothetical protein
MGGNLVSAGVVADVAKRLSRNGRPAPVVFSSNRIETRRKAADIDRA